MLRTNVKRTNPPPAGRQLLLSKQLGNRWNPVSLRIVREDLLLFVCGMWPITWHCGLSRWPVESVQLLRHQTLVMVQQRRPSFKSPFEHLKNARVTMTKNTGLRHGWGAMLTLTTRT